VHIDPYVIRTAHHAVAGVETHSDADREALRPAVGGEAELRCDRGTNCCRSARERGEKGIAFNADFGPAGIRNRLPDDQLMFL